MRKPPAWIERVVENGEDVSFLSSELPHRVRVGTARGGAIIHVNVGYGEFDLPLIVAEAISDIVVALRKGRKANG